MGLNHDSVDGLIEALEGEAEVGALPAPTADAEPTRLERARRDLRRLGLEARPRSLADLEPLRQELLRAARRFEPRQTAHGADPCDDAFEAAREIALLVNRALYRYGARGCPIEASAGGELTTNKYAAMGLAARRIANSLQRLGL